MGRALLLTHTHLFSPKSLFPLSLRHRPTAATATKRIFHFCPPLACRSMDQSSIDSVTQRLSNHNLHRLSLEDLKWDHSFVRELPADPRSDSFPREVSSSFSSLSISAFPIPDFYVSPFRSCMLATLKSRPLLRSKTLNLLPSPNQLPTYSIWTIKSESVTCLLIHPFCVYVS